MKSLFTALALSHPELNIRHDVSYREVTSFGIGSGSIPVLAEPESVNSLNSLLLELNNQKIPYFILGAGTNVIGTDTPYSGVIIRLCSGDFNKIEWDTANATCHVGAGVKLIELARQSAHVGLGGISPLTGIPASVGGALRMNAGANALTIGELVESIQGVRGDGSPWSCMGSEIDWQYRQNSIPQDVIICKATLKFTPVNAAEELETISKELRSRRQHEPKRRNAGCIFKNYGANSAGAIIDQCGLKKLQVGNLMVSEEHANFILNLSDSSCQNLLDIMVKIRQSVAEQKGIYLEPEVRFVDSSALDYLYHSVVAPSVALLKGGTSSEREVSLRSGAAVALALRNAGIKVNEIDIQECAVSEEMQDADLVYPVLHGGFGENGQLQKELEKANLNFVGSGSVASELVMDKLATKRRLDELKLPTAKWTTVTPLEREFPAGFQLPVVVKAPWEGSTIGIALIEKMEDWDSTLDEIFKYDSTLLVEAFVKGVEITVPVVNGDILPAIEICSPNGFYDFDAKYLYKQGQTQYLCPAQNISPEALQKANEYALKFFNEFGCRDILRVDFIIGADDVPYILEGNSLPGCTATSLVPKAAKVAGISFENLVASIVKNRIEKR